MCRTVPLSTIALVCLAAFALAGCSAKHYKKSADKEVYEILKNRRKTELGDSSGFTIERTAADVLAGLPRRFQPLMPDEAYNVVADVTLPTDPQAIISLTDAIRIALTNSRDYQSRKEDLYLQALSLTLDRHRFSPTFTALLSGRWTRQDKDEYWSGDADFGFSQTLATGGTAALNGGVNALKYMVGPDGHSVTSSMAFSFVQPLWRGAGERIARENLRQAERDVIYSIRSFARYHRTFAVSIARQYYALLQQRDRVRNEWSNYQRLVEQAARAADMAEAGRLEEFQVDQARQDELSAKDGWIAAVQTYRGQLDEFKITLGLPTDAEVDVDEADLRRLAGAGIIHPAINAEAAVSQALQLRLDLMTSYDQLDDAERKVNVAKNGLGPDVDLVVSASATSDENQPTRYRFEDARYSAGLDVDLPLDRKSERNAYRSALIQLDRQERATAEFADNVKLQVREAWRSLQEAKESYDIQRISLELAQRRVESNTLLLQAGRASTRDLLEAQRALLDAQNALTRTLVNHTLAKLELWRDIGTLLITSDYDLEVENVEDFRNDPEAG